MRRKRTWRMTAARRERTSMAVCREHTRAKRLLHCQHTTEMFAFQSS